MSEAVFLFMLQAQHLFWGGAEHFFFCVCSRKKICWKKTESIVEFFVSFPFLTDFFETIRCVKSQSLCELFTSERNLVDEFSMDKLRSKNLVWINLVEEFSMEKLQWSHK